jgi:hypothetical protein
LHLRHQVGDEGGPGSEGAGDPSNPLITREIVGPARRLLDRAMIEAGFDCDLVTNAVKHFDFVQRGKRRIQQKLNAGEVRHYCWWLAKELDLVHPNLVVALGITAVLALGGKALQIARSRGEARFEGRRLQSTCIRSSYCSSPGEVERRRAYDALVSDTKLIRVLSERDEPGVSRGLTDNLAPKRRIPVNR